MVTNAQAAPPRMAQGSEWSEEVSVKVQYNGRVHLLRGRHSTRGVWVFGYFPEGYGGPALSTRGGVEVIGWEPWP